MIVLQIIIATVALVLLVIRFLRRNMPQVGGKLGPVRTA